MALVVDEADPRSGSLGESLAGLLQAAGIPLDRRLRASSAHLRRVGSAPQPT